jgi:hypothetical protein
MATIKLSDVVKKTVLDGDELILGTQISEAEKTFETYEISNVIEYIEDNATLTTDRIESADGTKTIIATNSGHTVTGDATFDDKVKINDLATSGNEEVVYIDPSTKELKSLQMINMLIGTGTLVTGNFTVNDTRISASSKAFATPTTTGTSTGPIKVSKSTGAILFSSSTDTATFDYIIIL